MPVEGKLYKTRLKAVIAPAGVKARRLVKGYVEHYNNVRLNSAIGYITPKNMLAGHQQEIRAERNRKLEAARQQRRNRRLRVW
jgi:predicted signal transduction protein with EAL and GGDEF domain